MCLCINMETHVLIIEDSNYFNDEYNERIPNLLIVNLPHILHSLYINITEIFCYLHIYPYKSKIVSKSYIQINISCRK